jgi:starch synthase
MADIEVLAVASEVFPLVKTGGLADVAGALPGALKPQGYAVRTLVPGYPSLVKRVRRSACVHTFADLFGGPARLIAGEAEGLDLFVLDAPHLYDRAGGPYLDERGHDFEDNAVRFAALARAGASLAQGALARYRPTLAHAHDWQAGLLPAYLAYDGGPLPGMVFTVHNLAFQGRFSQSLLGRLGLPARALSVDGIEYYGGIGFLKAGLRLADRITTVSPTYAAEICTPDGGMGLDGLIRGRADRLTGILNGIDTTVWNPAADGLIAAPYDAGDTGPRALNKADLQARLCLDADRAAPLFGVISRLTWQKGMDLLLEALPVLLEQGGQLALLGAGDADLEARFAAAAGAHAGRIGCVFGYDEATAHRIQAGADAILVPSRFEPCGLTQLCALRYGAVPVVSRVGGLADTVIDAGPMALAAGAGTGVQFAPVSAHMLESAIRRSVRLFQDHGAWARLQANGIAADVSWREPAKRYAELFAGLIAERAA